MSKIGFLGVFIRLDSSVYTKSRIVHCSMHPHVTDRRKATVLVTGREKAKVMLMHDNYTKDVLVHLLTFSFGEALLTLKKNFGRSSASSIRLNTLNCLSMRMIIL